MAPRAIVTRPVRTISRMPYGCSTSTRLSTFSSAPVTSTISESGATSTMRARKTSASCMISTRVSRVAVTLTSARSRVTDGRLVTSSTRSTSISL